MKVKKLLLNLTTANRAPGKQKNSLHTFSRCSLWQSQCSLVDLTLAHFRRQSVNFHPDNRLYSVSLHQLARSQARLPPLNCTHGFQHHQTIDICQARKYEHIRCCQTLRQFHALLGAGKDHVWVFSSTAQYPDHHQRYISYLSADSISAVAIKHIIDLVYLRTINIATYTVDIMLFCHLRNGRFKVTNIVYGVFNLMPDCCRQRPIRQTEFISNIADDAVGTQ